MKQLPIIHMLTEKMVTPIKKVLLCSSIASFGLLSAMAQPTAQPWLDKIHHKHSFEERLDAASSLFLGQPYLLGALGEGESGEYDQNPLYRFDGFDCVTYVNTSLALAMAQTEPEFLQYLTQLGYQAGQVNYLQRNHFTSLDWNEHNKALLKDITADITNSKGESIVQRSDAMIDKRAWIMRKTAKDLNLPKASENTKASRVMKLHRAAQAFEPQNVSINYLPLTALFDGEGQPDKTAFSQIPHGAVIEIVRPNWDLTKQIGTHLHVSHLGFAIRKPGSPVIFRQASSLEHRVMECDLATYLKGYLKSPTVKGIAVLVPSMPKH